MWSHRLAGDGFPFAAGRKGRSAAAGELRVEHFAEHAVRSEIERLAQRLVTAVRLVVVEAAGVDRAGSREQTQRRISALGNDRARSLERWRFAGEQRAGDLRSHRSDGALHGSRSRDGEKCGGRALAKTETRRA